MTIAIPQDISGATTDELTFNLDWLDEDGWY